MQIKEIVPLAEIKACYGEELRDYTGTLEVLQSALAHEPYYMGGAIANSWMQVCRKRGFDRGAIGHKFQRITLPGFETTVPVPNKDAIEEIERLIGEPFIKAMVFSRCLFRGKMVAELLAMETYPNVLHLGEVTFLDLSRPIPLEHRWNERQTHKGLGLLPTVVARMKEYAFKHGLEWITISAATQDVIPMFATHGFRYANYDKARESRHMEMKVRNMNDGRCYELSRNWVSEHRDWILVHGTVKSNGERIGHAWCERGEEVIDLTQFKDGKTIRKTDFVIQQDAIPLRKFDFYQAFAEHSDRGHYGPWTD